MKVCSRRHFLRLSASSLAIGLGSSALGVSDFKLLADSSDKKKNVLFIAVDDLRPQLGCYGQKQIISPNMDKLASQGLLFENAYCQQAVCAPSRASLLSGLRPDSTGIYDLETPLRKAMPDILSLPECFKNQGYKTISIGKIYHHPNDDLQGWSEKPVRAGTFPDGPKGSWQGRGYLTDEAIEEMLAYGKNDPSKMGRGPAYEAADVDDNQYPDGMNVEYAIKKLQEIKDEPFFLAMGFHKPHLPFNAPKKYWDMYKPEDIKLAPNPFFPKGAPEIALSNWGELRGYSNMPKKDDMPVDEQFKLIHGYYACVSFMDAQLGKLLSELDRLGLRENTVIILWGDHGWKLGDHNMWCKHTNFETDTHAPMILSVPEMKKPGAKTKALVEFVDIYPTLCELCKIELPSHLEGTSMVPLLADENRKWKTAAFSQYPRQGEKVMGYSIKTKRFRYTEWQDRKTGQIVARELYDHQKDPLENENVVEKTEYIGYVEQHCEILKAGWKAAKPQL